MSRSMVLGNDGLLSDILIRVDSPTTVVRSALVSKRWFRQASGQRFLRSYRGLNPPRLLGIYVSGDGVPRLEFVELQTPQPPENTTAAARRADFGFGDVAEFASTIWDSRNGRVLYEFGDAFDLPSRAPAVRTPLQYRGRDVAVLPPPPAAWPECPYALLLPDDDGDDATCYRLDVDLLPYQTVTARVSVLRAGEWSICCSVEERLARPPLQIHMTTLLAGGKIYMVTVAGTAGYILGLDLATKRFFVVELPDGVAFEYHGNLLLCRGDGDVLYLFHVKGDKLSLWRHRMDAGAGVWVLKETVALKKACREFIEQEREPAEQQVEQPAEQGPEAVEQPAEQESEAMEDEPEAVEQPAEQEPEAVEQPAEEYGAEPAEPEAPIMVVGVGDNAEFVFLELGDTGVIVCMYLGSKVVEKVYQRDPDDDNVIRVHPFTMIWPPSFPALHDDEGDEPEHQE